MILTEVFEIYLFCPTCVGRLEASSLAQRQYEAEVGRAHWNLSGFELGARWQAGYVPSNGKRPR